METKRDLCATLLAKKICLFSSIKITMLKRHTNYEEKSFSNTRHSFVNEFSWNIEHEVHLQLKWPRKVLFINNTMLVIIIIIIFIVNFEHILHLFLVFLLLTLNRWFFAGYAPGDGYIVITKIIANMLTYVLRDKKVFLLL